MILNETLNLIKTRYESQFNTTTIKRVNIGAFFAVVQLSSGFCGLSSVDSSTLSSCCKLRKKEFGAFSPGKNKRAKTS